MLLESFPDINLLKELIQHHFNDRGWPNVVLHTQCRQIHRPDIQGPLSIFLNLKGESLCGVDGHTVTIPEGHYFITNHSQHYTLGVDNHERDQASETFNIHFGTRFTEEVYEGLIQPADQLLSDPWQKETGSIAFYNKLYPKDEQFRQQILDLYYTREEWRNDHMLLEEKLYDLLVNLLQVHRNVLKEVEQLPPVKSSTKTELYKRLSHSVDYMHTHFQQTLDLETLAQIACISKYHFLRLFKLAFGKTPHQYISELRVQHAKQLLTNTDLSVLEIANTTGFENSSSFSRLFHQHTDLWPQHYRQMAV